MVSPHLRAFLCTCETSSQIIPVFVHIVPLLHELEVLK